MSRSFPISEIMDKKKHLSRDYIAMIAERANNKSYLKFKPV